MRTHRIVWRARCTVLLAALGSALLPSLVPAQPYPARPVRIVVPYTPGGGADSAARAVGTRLGELWGRPVIIENRPGASTNIGTDIVAKSAPDGHTMLLGTAATTVNHSLYPSLPFDLVRDFAPVSLIGVMPNILAVHPGVPVASVAELVTLAKARPGELTYGSSGNGSSNHLSGELFNLLAGTRIVHVPYRGGPQAVTDLIGGQITMYFGSFPSTLPHVATGRLRALAMTGARRSKVVPELPTVAEAGLPGFEIVTWFGLLVPVATPPAVVSRINADTSRALDSPEVMRLMAAQSVEISGGPPSVLAAFLKNDIAKFAKLVRSAGMKPE